MKLSNDIKWNKIKAIEKELSHTWDYYMDLYSESPYKVAKKKADLEVWLLANKILEIASPLKTDYQNIMLAQKAKWWSKTPIHWSTTLERINEVSKCYTTIAFYQEIESAWAEYDYANS
jgi:hypothetical protein